MNSSQHDTGNFRNGEHRETPPTQKGQDIMEQAKALRDEAEKAYEAVSAETRRMGEYAKAQAELVAQKQKHGIAESIAHFAGSVRSVADGLPDHPNLQSLAQQAADRIEQASRSLDRKSLSELYDDSEEACRRYPVAVGVGTLVVGMLISRLIKSSGRTTA